MSLGSRELLASCEVSTWEGNGQDAVLRVEGKNMQEPQLLRE